MKSILLIGTNRLGSLLVREFHKLGHQVMAVDKNEARINSVLPFVTDAQIGDSTNAAFLRSLGVASFDVCIVTIGGDFQSSLETTSLLKELGGKLVVARADREVQAKFLLRNGADEVISPEKQVAEWAAIRYASDHVLDYVKLDEEHAIFEVAVPAEWAGRIAAGAPADLCIADLHAAWSVGPDFASKASNSPFIGETLPGVIRYTIVGGRIVYQSQRRQPR